MDLGYRTQCWVWQRYCNDKGYGMVRVASVGRPVLTHRLAWHLFGLSIPEWPYVLCHDCDHPACVRPDHLFIGTRADNNDDMRAKGRGSAPPVSRGERNPAAKLTEIEVREIRRLGKTTSQRELSRRYGVSRPAIRSIILNLTWRDVK